VVAATAAAVVEPASSAAEGATAATWGGRQGEMQLEVMQQVGVDIEVGAVPQYVLMRIGFLEPSLR